MTRRLLLSLAATVLALFLAEGLVRLWGVAPEVVVIEEGHFRLSANPRLGYEPVPFFEHHGPLTSFHDVLGRANSLGFRDLEHGMEKPSGIYRILVLGDSIAAGQGVAELDEIFHRRLEDRLRRAGRVVEVLSFAVSGYNTGQEVALLAERGLAYRPDLVLVAYCLNDRGRSDGGILAALEERARGHGATVRVRYHPLLARSALYRMLVYRLVDPAAGAPEIPAGDTRAAALDELATLAAEHGFAVAVAIFPRFGQLLDYPEEWAQEISAAAQLAAHRGFLVIDLLDAFRACRALGHGRLAFDRYHPTALGHDCAAEAVARELAEEMDGARPGG
jgi:lysophospholipase L1-like esterase